MKAVVQRVQFARVKVQTAPGQQEDSGAIEKGLLTLLGVGHGDTEKEVDWLINKIVKLRIFEDENGKMNKSLQDIGGAHLLVSQFTLFADCSSGNRPSFTGAADLKTAEALYEKAIALSRQLGVKTEQGRFRADMKVELLNDGPVTIILDTNEN